MAHKEWCGKPCADCLDPCRLDESMPCSPNCELLGADGEPNIRQCIISGCDAIIEEVNNMNVDHNAHAFLHKLLPENWELNLDLMMLKNNTNSCRKRAYICSPCRSDKPEGVLLNMRIARLYTYYAHLNIGLNAYAPHSSLPTILCDERITERQMALRFGCSLMELSNELLVCGKRLSKGMRHEIEYATEIGLPIRVFDKELLIEVRKIVTRKNGDKRLASYDEVHRLLAMDTETLQFFLGGGANA